MHKKISSCYIFILFAFLACQTPKSADQRDEISLSDTSTHDLKVAAYDAKTGYAENLRSGGPHTGKKTTSKPERIEWLACIPKDKKNIDVSLPYVLMLHDESVFFRPDTFCSEPQAQAFMADGNAVLGINRPGFGGSTGERDFSGKSSLAAIEAGMAAAQKDGFLGTAKLVGVWGYGSGVIAACNFARGRQNVIWLILGGGIYDLDAIKRESSSSEYKNAITAVASIENDEGLEYRSISYDLTGLPKKIYLYHGTDDSAAPVAQAKAFRDNLASSEFSVVLNTANGIGHDMNANIHRNLLSVTLQAIKTRAKP